MSRECKINKWITDGISISIQIAFTFAFLTVFFFIYVQKVEKDEFQSQMNMIVDNIMKDMENNISTLISKQDLLSEEESMILINGVIDTLQEKIAMDSKNTVQDILEQNHAVKIKAFKSLMSVITLIIIVFLIIILIGFCIPINSQIKEAMIVVIFVGFTELIFLEVIAKHYISASPNKVKRSLVQSIQKWIKNNGK